MPYALLRFSKNNNEGLFDITEKETFAERFGKCFKSIRASDQDLVVIDETAMKELKFELTENPKMFANMMAEERESYRTWKSSERLKELRIAKYKKKTQEPLRPDE